MPSAVLRRDPGRPVSVRHQRAVTAVRPRRLVCVSTLPWSSVKTMLVSSSSRARQRRQQIADALRILDDLDDPARPEAPGFAGGIAVQRDKSKMNMKSGMGRADDDWRTSAAACRM